ncbi:hypothetical protein [Chitinophaga sp. Ak27]|uniref:hypothetical protein n=1 Tax=Chitinophaga sp. Ak27 TaxID=2726116 RepID=UPI00145D1E77|nr:hypothetical protein [Chitinophaga sp. Ak27]NLU90429.1 hypothetical protein [Chitinophaga sp. Ak27]
MENESSSIFEHDFFAATAIRRRELMSTWLKIYVWLYIVWCAFTLLAALYMIIAFNVSLRIDFLSGAINLILPVMRIVSCLLIWLEKKEAILIALIVTGIILCVQGGGMIYQLTQGLSFANMGDDIRSVLFGLPFLVMLVKIKKDWETMAFSKKELESKSL